METNRSILVVRAERLSCRQFALCHVVVESGFRQMSLMGQMIADARDVCRPCGVLVPVIGKYNYTLRLGVPKHPLVIRHALHFGESKVEQQLTQFLVCHFRSHA
jgi:hypothetical protein